jgi:1-phosphatidylinositol-4-phosphate 5-kinase
MTSIELATLCKRYRFAPQEILQFRQRFDYMSRDKRHRFVTLQEFRENMGLLGLESTNTLADRIFSSMDKDKTGQVSFRYYLDYMDVLLHGSDDEKSEQSYKLITKGSLEPISQEAFSDMMISILKLLNTIGGNRVVASSDMLAHLFQQLDLDRDGFINLQDYKTGWKSNKRIFEWLDFLNNCFADRVNPMEAPEDDEESLYQHRLLEIEEELKTCIAMLKGEKKAEPLELAQSSKSIFEVSPKDVYLGFLSSSNSLRPHPRTHDTHAMTLHLGDEPLASIQRSLTYNRTEADPEELRLFRKGSLPQGEMSVEALQVRPDLSDEDSSPVSGQEWRKSSFKISVLPPEGGGDNAKIVAGRLDNLLKVASALRTDYQHKESLAEAARASIPSPHSEKPSVRKNTIQWGDTNWNLILNMMLGIQKAVKSSAVNFDPMGSVGKKEAMEKVKVNLLAGVNSEVMGMKKLYKFRDYAPIVFEHIKRLRKVTVKDYIKSLGVQKIVESLLVGNFSSLDGLMTTGKSGSFFFYSDDGKYLIKTMTKSEFMFLRSILHHYYEHIRNYPNTLLSFIFGLHKLLCSQKGPKMQRLYICVLGNVFSSGLEIHQRYDLKGSTYGRRTKPTEELTVARKDVDFTSAKMRISVGPARAHELLAQLAKDTEFLGAHHIIDYSLLVGIHNIDPSENIDNSYESRDLHESVMPATTGICLYQLGIIDCLTLYSTGKKLEHCLKSCFHPGNVISCIPPGPYAQRFMDFMSRAIE